MIVEMQNASKEKTKNKARSTNSNAIIFRERVANRSQRVSIRHQFVDSIVHDFDHDFDHELESRSFEMKSDQNQEKKRNERLKSNIFLEFSSIS
jgi:lipoate-protein ligase A